MIENFTQQEPNEGEPATERTIVRLMYDSESLYIAMEAHDSIADGVIATEMRRDSLQLLDEDNFQIILDTFNDRRSGYMFVTSPLGAKLEQQISELEYQYRLGWCLECVNTTDWKRVGCRDRNTDGDDAVSQDGSPDMGPQFYEEYQAQE